MFCGCIWGGGAAPSPPAPLQPGSGWMLKFLFQGIKFFFQGLVGVKPLNLFSRGCNFFFQGLPASSSPPWKLLQCAWMTGNFCRAREVAIWKAGLFWTTKQQSENKWLIWQHHFDQSILGAGLVLHEHAQRLHGKLQLPGKTIPMSWNSSW